MVKKPTIMALSSLVALSVPTISEKLSTSEMRKNSIKANAVELGGDNEKDIPLAESGKGNSAAADTNTVSSDPDLITVELSQDGTTTVIGKNTQPLNNTSQNSIIVPNGEKKNDLVPDPVMTGSAKLDITKVELLSIKSSDLKFGTNSARISEEAAPALKDIKDYVEKNDYVVTIVGYTDSTGARSYNEKLSLRRAESVSQKLIELGLSPTRIVEILGKGDENPVADNNTEDGRIANRRVEFRLTKRGVNLF